MPHVPCDTPVICSGSGLRCTHCSWRKPSRQSYSCILAWGSLELTHSCWWIECRIAVPMPLCLPTYPDEALATIYAVIYCSLTQTSINSPCNATWYLDLASNTPGLRIESHSIRPYLLWRFFSESWISGCLCKWFEFQCPQKLTSPRQQTQLEETISHENAFVWISRVASEI